MTIHRNQKWKKRMTIELLSIWIKQHRIKSTYKSLYISRHTFLYTQTRGQTAPSLFIVKVGCWHLSKQCLDKESARLLYIAVQGHIWNIIIWQEVKLHYRNMTTCILTIVQICVLKLTRVFKIYIWQCQFVINYNMINMPKQYSDIYTSYETSSWSTPVG